MRKPCSNSDLAQKNVPHSESFAVHALICKTLTNQGFADKKNSAFQQNCSKNGVPSLGAGDEESAEAPPAADEARRFRGSVPAVGCGSRRQPADTTVSAEAHTKKNTTCRVVFLERATRLELASRHPTNGCRHSQEPCLTS